uniref:D-alanine--D-alanine ligase C-terminal domain-containing protein n=1 Tax=Acrobeloides nanus TaxID=290746 RepID=A0A914CQ30_9BILA
MPKDFEKNFDEIFWYQADYTGFEDLYSDLKEISLPELDLFLSLAITLIPTQKIRLIESEEHIMTTICILRKKYSIPGPSYEDLEPLRNKALIKQIAEKEGIPSAKFAIVNFEQVQDLEQEIEKIKTRIGKFPMFCKPVHGVGCGGSEKIEHENELRKWIHDMISTSKNAVYLVEEYVYGLEFNSAVCLLQDGTWRPLQITYFPEK